MIMMMIIDFDMFSNIFYYILLHLVLLMHGSAVVNTVWLLQESPGFEFWPRLILHGVCAFAFPASRNMTIMQTED